MSFMDHIHIIKFHHVYNLGLVDMLPLVVMNLFIFTKYNNVIKNLFAFSIISQHRGSSRPSQKTMTMVAHADNVRSQGISSHDIEQVILKYFCLSAKRVNTY